MDIISLFDSEHDTVKKSLRVGCKVYSFGLGSGTGHVKLDLSNFEQAKRELGKYPVPAMLFAFPPCSEIASLRSRFPSGLCQDIFNQAKAGGVPQLFPEFL